MKRGEIWWADLPPPVGRRPVLLLSRDVAYAVRANVTVAPVTRTVRGIAVEVPVGPAQGLAKPGVVNLDDLMTVPKALLSSRITVLDRTLMEEVARAIVFALDLPITP